MEAEGIGLCHVRMLRVSAHTQEGGDAGQGAQRGGLLWVWAEQGRWNMIDYHAECEKKGGPLPPLMSQEVCMSPARKDGDDLASFPFIRSVTSAHSPLGASLQETARNCQGLGKNKL